MAVATGARLSAYEILGPLGAGGMGEVYRARDTKLGRDVALKFLPGRMTGDPERVARFRREAQVLASLNHSHIGAIYGLDDAHGDPFLVLELVDGVTLADRIAKGPLPLEEALAIAKQIVVALEAAHEKGIIHRDLKPANIALTANDQVKVLDFGLAKLAEAAGPELRTSEPERAGGVSQSPTITTPAMTAAGVILGTAAYMSPEQAKGRVADKRSDIWAFGCVLYEMLTGRRAFQGEDVSETLASVLRSDPEWSALPPGTPPAVRRLLRRCLEKDRTHRLRDVGDGQLELEEPVPRFSEGSSPRTPSRLTVWWWAVWVASLAAASLLITIVMWSLLRRSEAPSMGPFRLTLDVPPGITYGIGPRSGLGLELALSPDGTRLVFAAEAENGQRMLYMRDLRQGETQPVHGSDDAINPFFSHDGEWLAFFHAPAGGAKTQLKKVAIRGGTPTTIAENAFPAGGAWGSDNTIVFGQRITAGSNNVRLMQVSGVSGEPQMLTTPNANEQAHTWPAFLPGGRAILFSVRTGTTYADGAHVAVLSLSTGEYHMVVEQGYHARYVSTGHIVYAVGGSLMAVPFDVDRLQTTGSPVPVQEGIRSVGGVAGEAHFAVSGTGHLVFSPGSLSGDTKEGRTLMWVSRNGAEEAVSAPPRPYAYPRLSPDGTQLALDVRDSDSEIWVWRFARQTLTRVTTQPGLDFGPVWAVDGSRLIFGSTRSNTQNLASQPSDGTGVREWLAESPRQQFPTAISPDGKRVIFQEDLNDIRMLSMEDGQVVSLLDTPYREMNGDISPDGRWLAYQSDESGRFEIYVRPFPDVSRSRSQVSANGGTRPRWSRNGRELFYHEDTGSLSSLRMMVSPVQIETSFSAGQATQLFEGPYFQQLGGRTYDVSLDGQRFLMIKAAPLPATQTSSPFVVVLNWQEELKRLVPTR